MVLDCTGGDCGNGAGRIHRWRSGDAPVELAAAAACRLASTYVLASFGITGAVPDSVRRAGRPRASPQPGMALPRPLPEPDAGGAREIPAGDGGGLHCRCARYGVVGL